MSYPILHNTLKANAGRLSEALEHMSKLFLAPREEKSLRSFTTAEVAELLRVSEGYLRKAHFDGRIPEVEQGAGGKRLYSADDIRHVLSQTAKDPFQFLPGRRDGDKLQIWSTVNFKGGSSKTTTTVTLGMRLALRGYRVCLVDADPQASLTTFFGYQPELDFREGGTLYDAIRYNDGDTTRVPITDVLRKIYFPGLDLVPGGIILSEYETETPTVLSRGERIDPAEIADSDIADRFDIADGLDDLVASIQASGQQLPALLRFRRGAGPRDEVVYGRRRIAACRKLGLKVRVYIREMDHREALVSQALENSARLERSFIEQAIFAVRLEEQGFSRADIGDVLAVDKGTLSKLVGVARDVPDAVIYAIGAAHDAGRRPWLELRRLVKLDTAPDEAALLAMIPDVDTPTDRLTGLIRKLSTLVAKGAKPPCPAPVSPPTAPVRSTARGNRLTIEVSGNSDTAFIGFVEARLAALYQDWKSGKG